MQRLSLVLLVALALAPGALAAGVHVRVEGKTQTLFGAAEPTLTAGTALDALEAGSVAGEFYYHLQSSSFGNYVDQVGRYKAEGQTGWVFKVNGVSPPVGADKVTLKDGDRVLWYWAQFGVAGGPDTLDLRRAGKGCYSVVRQDDNGKSAPAVGAVLTVDRRVVKTTAAKGCPGPHKGLVRATLPGSVRSNALT